MLALPLLLAAQTYNIVGKVIDASTLQPLEFVNVITGQNGSITDKDGQFAITGLKNGTYELTISFVGYTPVKKSVTIKGANVQAGKIKLSEDTESLKEVEVVAQGTTARFELDKKIYSVDQNIAAAGGSVTDALENIPTVDVDQEGNISLRNSESVEVWINGKPSGLSADNRADIMKQMPAESIKEIEIITNPSAKYSPEGTSGIINLVMKENRQAGYYGSVNAGIDYALAAPWNHAPGGNVGFNLNFNKGIVEGYVNLGYHYRNNIGTQSSTRYSLADGVSGHKGFDPETEDYLSKLVTDGSQHMYGGGIFARAGLDFRLAEHSTLGVSGFGIIEDPKALKGTTSSDVGYTETDSLRKQTQYSREQTGKDWHPGGNAMLTYQFKKDKHQLDVTAQYMNFGFNRQQDFKSIDSDGTIRSNQTQNSRDKDHMVEAKFDYEWKINDKSKLQAGYQMNWSYRTNYSDGFNNMDDGTQQEINSLYTDFRNREQTHALYITYGNKFFNRLSIMVGLRAEIFNRHLDSYHKDNDGQISSDYDLDGTGQDTTYFQLYPSAYIGYEFDGGHELQLNYTRRVERPRGHQLSPYQNMSDSLNISQGNPSLLPTYSSNMELNYLKNWERHSLSVGGFWRYKKGLIQSVSAMDGNIMRTTYINANNRHEVGGDITARNRFFGQVLQMMTSIEVYYNKMNGDNYSYYLGNKEYTTYLPGQSAVTWSARLSLNFMFTKTFTGQISGRYRSPMALAQGESTHSYNIDVGLRKTFLDHKLAISLNVRDLLNSRARRSNSWGDDFYMTKISKWDSRTISLSISYSFGNNKKHEKGNNNTPSNADDTYLDTRSGESGWSE